MLDVELNVQLCVRKSLYTKMVDTEVRLYRAAVLPVVIYGSETWTVMENLVGDWTPLVHGIPDM